MAGTDTNQAYVSMMSDSLKKKSDILKKLLALTESQENMLKSDDMDRDEFDGLTDDKGKYIDELNKLDEGFDSLYKRLEQELMDRRADYVDEISDMKDMIKQITDLSSRIQAIEKKNYDRFQNYIVSERGKIRQANMSQQTAKTYAQNMHGGHSGNSYFVNETK